MKNSNKPTTVQAFSEILKKIKKLKTDTIYHISVVGKKSDGARVYLSRLADRGEIVKLERGYFYKPSSRALYKASTTKIPLSKSLFANDLFWSVNDGFKVDTSELIRAYLKNYTQDDLMVLYTLFGYKSLIKHTLYIYKKRSDPSYKKIRQTLEMFEKWRMDDKRD